MVGQQASGTPWAAAEIGGTEPLGRDEVVEDHRRRVASAVARGYLCLALSFFRVHVLLGVLVALTMVTSSAATVAFLPLAILLVTPKVLRRKLPAVDRAAAQRSVA